MRDANHTTPKNVMKSRTIEVMICHRGTPNGIRINITIGDVKGMNENRVAMVPCGSFITVKNPT